MRASSRTVRGLAPACAAAVVLAVVTFPAHAGAPSASLTADPSTSLTDGQFVKLTMTRFAAFTGVAFRQCIASATSVATDCTVVNTQVTGITDATGYGTTYLPVYEGGDPALRNAAGTGSIVCDTGHACVIAGMHDVNSLSTAVLAPLTFAPSPSACPPPGPTAVLGSGSSSAYRAVYAWESSVCRPPTSLSVGYTVTNSPDGVSNFFNGLTDFAVTGPIPPVTAPPSAPTFRYAPLTTSGIVLGFRMYDRRGPQITSLTLTPSLVAQIFRGQLSNWSASAAIRALNPGVLFPSRVVPFARAEHEADSYVFTAWLAATAPSAWTSGPQAIFPLPPSGVRGVTGSAGVGRAVVDPTTDFFDQGNIGFMDSSTAAFYGLPTVHIARADGSVVAATPQTIGQAVADATTNADGTIIPDYATTDPLAYPMPMPAYMLAPTNTISPDRAAVLATFLRYAVQGGQASLPPGYAVLPPSLGAVSLRVADAISPAVPATPPSPSPSPPPSPQASPKPPAAAAPAALPLSLGSPLGTTAPVVAPLRVVRSILPSSGPPAPAAAPRPAVHQAAAASGVAGPPSLPLGAAAGFTQLIQAGQSAARFVLPSVCLLGLLGVLGGFCLQMVGRRRRLVPDGGAAALGPGLHPRADPARRG